MPLADISFSRSPRPARMARSIITASPRRPTGARGWRALSDRFRRAVSRRHDRHHPHLPSARRANGSTLCSDRFTRVLKGHISIATARFPKGTTGAQLDTLARTALWQAGLDFDHGTGHGVGAYLSVHEGPQRIAKLGTRHSSPA